MTLYVCVFFCGRSLGKVLDFWWFQMDGVSFVLTYTP